MTKTEEINPQKLSNIITQVKRILQHQEELEVIRGEKFNVFQILGMRTKEDRLHSRFITELLNPKGSHLQGDVFLKIFLEIVNVGEEVFDVSANPSVIKEKNLGRINTDKSEGGFVDIFISNGKDQNICIENKIYAGDQQNQIFRYCNYNKEKNTVFYLTLYGKEPEEKSKNGLTSDLSANDEKPPDFFCISYQDHIQDWLKRCLEVSHSEPILRESIRQYLISIQQLTHTMDNKEKKEFEELLLNNFKEVQVIAKQFPILTKQMIKAFKKDICVALKSKLSEFEVRESKEAHQHIQIFDKTDAHDVFKYCIDNFVDGSPLTIKTVWRKSHRNNKKLENFIRAELKRTTGTIKSTNISFNNDLVRLGNEAFFTIINDKKDRKALLDAIVEQTVDYIKQQKNDFADKAVKVYLSDMKNEGSII